MSEYKIEIYSRNKNVFDDLMEYDPCLNTNRQFIIIKNLDKNKIKKIKRYCNKKKLRYNLINSSFERGSAYRRTFFNSNKSVHNHYFCAYCGRYIPKEKITVDHIIPIYSVKYSPFKQKILKMFGINNINCEKNLTPACFHCNRQKGTKGGVWSLRGIIGKHQYLWFVRHAIMFSLLNIGFYYFYNYVFHFLK